MADEEVYLSPHVNCENLLQALRRSNLNFSINESPYSVQICIRKRFLKVAQNIPYPKTFVSESGGVDLKKKLSESENVREMLEAEILKLRTDIVNREAAVDENWNTIKILEDKLEKSEKEAFDILKKNKTFIDQKNDEAKTLKSVITNGNIEMNKIKTEVNLADKSLKMKDKEVYNLENIKLTQLETIKKKTSLN